MPKQKYLNTDGVFLFINVNFNLERYHFVFKLIEFIFFQLFTQLIYAVSYRKVSEILVIT